MYKWMLSLFVMILAGATVAQGNSASRGKTPNPRISVQKPISTPHPIQSKAIIWSSTFSNPQDWVIGNSAGNNANWQISDSPYFWWSSNAPLASNSGGYAASFNSDGFATGPNQTVNNAWIESAPFSCGNFGTVAVSFQQFFNKWSGKTIIQVTNNNGQTWVDYEVNEGLENNDETDNPSTVMVDITATAAYEQEVKIRFLYLSNAISDGGTDNTDGVAWDYGWIVDDVQVAELPDNDIALIKAWHANILTDYEYSRIPLSQASEFKPGVVVANQGALQQSFEVEVTITDDSGIVNTTNEIVTLPYAARDTVWFNTGYTPTGAGEYNFIFTVSADQDPSDNEVEASELFVGENLMAHDYGNANIYGWDPNANDTTIVNFANAPHSWGNIFVPENDQLIYGVDVNFANGTTPGILLSVRVQRFDALGGIQGNLQLVTERTYTVQSSDIGSGITTIDFLQPSMLIGGSGYIIDVFKIDPTTNSGFFIGGSEESCEDDDLAAVAYGNYGQGTSPNYYVNWGFAPYIRANFNAILSLEEDALDPVSIYPNPSEGLLTVQSKDGSVLRVQVLSNDGRILLSKEDSDNVQLDLTSYASGIYTVRVNTGAQVLLKKILLQ